MLVKDLGEFQLIEMLALTVADEAGDCLERLSRHGFRLRLSIGDDAAAWDSPSGVRVLTTDTMVEGVHFHLNHIGWRNLGWKAMAVNLSDVAAMGCAPLYSVVTLGLRGDLPADGLVEMYRGMLEACDSFGGAIVGGDIVRSPVFFVTVAMEGTGTASKSGEADAASLLTRHSASLGDKIAVTGSLGCSGGGLRMLIQAARVSSARPVHEATVSHLLDAHHRPLPRVPEGMTLAHLGVACAMDISDGLVDDLGKICKASGVGAVIHADRVPADAFLREAYPNDWLALALSGGEDYELLFTATPGLMERVAATLDVPVSVIGDVVDGPPEVRVLDRHGKVMPVERGGWDHFRR